MIKDSIITGQSYTWTDIHHPLEEEIENLFQEYQLPWLLAQNCIRPEHLPKSEETEKGYVFILRVYDDLSSEAAMTVQDMTNKLVIIIQKKEILTIHKHEQDFIRTFAHKTSRRGFPDTVQGFLYQLIRAIVVSYEDPINELQSQYEIFEQMVLSGRPDKLDHRDVYRFRRKIFIIKRMLRDTDKAVRCGFWVGFPQYVQNLKESIDELYFYLEDISNNFDQLFQLSVTMADQRANEVMKILTLFASLLLPLTFIVSFYGMNFQNLPGVHTDWGLGIICLIMILNVLFVIRYFRRRGWFNVGN